MIKVLLAILAIFLPPVAVALSVMDDDKAFHIVLSILLCVLLWVPSVIHAWYCVAKYGN